MVSSNNNYHGNQPNTNIRVHCNFYFKVDRKRLQISDKEHARYEKKRLISNI